MVAPVMPPAHSRGAARARGIVLFSLDADNGSRLHGVLHLHLCYMRRWSEQLLLFVQMKDPGVEFRDPVSGTIGWIAPAWRRHAGSRRGDAAADRGGASILLGLLSGAPHPPRSRRRPGARQLGTSSASDALKLMGERFVAVFVIGSFLICSAAVSNTVANISSTRSTSTSGSKIRSPGIRALFHAVMRGFSAGSASR